MSENVETTKFSLLNDIPILEKDRTDLLEFGPFAEVLGEAAVNTKGSITIGIFGKWGTGKTSMMRLIMDKINNRENVAPVWFNAWQYEREEHLIIPLTTTITRTIDKYVQSNKWESKVAEAGKALQNALRSVVYGFSLKGKFGIPGLTGAEANVSLKDMINRYDELAEEFELGRSIYYDAFTKLNEYGDQEENKAPRVVVFIDDLDRCFPENAVALLEGIKLILNQPGFSFIIGIHDEIIREFVKTKYAKECAMETRFFEDYLDKIVQVKVSVPEREPDDMHKYIEALLTEGNIVPENEVVNFVSLIADCCNRNPRSVIRLLNRVMVTTRIGELVGKTYDPIALILDMATDGSKYAHLRRVLDDMVQLDKSESEPVTFGSLIADSLADSRNGDASVGSLIDSMKTIRLKSRNDDLEKIVKTIADNTHIATIFKSVPGQQWLKDTQFRKSVRQAGQQTIGDAPEETDHTDDIIRQIEKNMVALPGGTFIMGDEDNRRIHDVTLSPFAIGAMPVTQEQYEFIMGNNPSEFKGENNPVESVSWEDAQAFCKKLSQKTGKEYSLPTEAQWEYACRAGSGTYYCFGDVETKLDEYAWFNDNSRGSTQPVGKKKPNEFGLYDMHGNVWEWCNDWHGDYPYDSVVDPAGPEKGGARVLRGGSWSFSAGRCRSAYRNHDNPGYRSNDVGFRLSRGQKEQ